LKNEFKKDLDLSIIRPAIITAVVICIILIIEKSTGIKLSYFGIVPRDMTGIPGILFSPFLHGGWEHLFSNIPSLIILMTIILYFYERSSIAILSLIWLFTGCSVWLFGKENTYHIGASGVIYGMMSFIFFSGIFRGERSAMIISLLVLLLNSSLFAGFQPTEGVSWESHLYGAICGLMLAFIFKSVNKNVEENEVKSAAPKLKYFQRDVFQYTKAQRWQMLQDELERERRIQLENNEEELGISQ
jgi:membrane associated rhomboid family serine protease